MKIIDISQEVFSCRVYPGDPVPSLQKLQDMKAGMLYNLSAFSMCTHNGTHIDAPAHFFEDGKTVDQLPPEMFAGECFVAIHEGEVRGGDARKILSRTNAPRILIAGNAVVTKEAAEVFASAGLLLLGNESQSVGPVDAPMAVHKILLGAGVVLLEGVVLADVPEGEYILSAVPLKLAGSEGAPCRAVLMC